MEDLRAPSLTEHWQERIFREYLLLQTGVSSHLLTSLVCILVSLFHSLFHILSVSIEYLAPRRPSRLIKF